MNKNSLYSNSNPICASTLKGSPDIKVFRWPSLVMLKPISGYIEKVSNSNVLPSPMFMEGFVISLDRIPGSSFPLSKRTIFSWSVKFMDQVFTVVEISFNKTPTFQLFLWYWAPRSKPKPHELAKEPITLRTIFTDEP